MERVYIQGMSQIMAHMVILRWIENKSTGAHALSREYAGKTACSVQITSTFSLHLSKDSETKYDVVCLDPGQVQLITMVRRAGNHLICFIVGADQMT